MASQMALPLVCIVYWRLAGAVEGLQTRAFPSPNLEVQQTEAEAFCMQSRNSSPALQSHPWHLLKKAFSASCNATFEFLTFFKKMITISKCSLYSSKVLTLARNPIKGRGSNLQPCTTLHIFVLPAFLVIQKMPPNSLHSSTANC